MSGLSGLDALVQAATEERERIDVHRRQSGGDEPQHSFSNTVLQRSSHSPVGLRSNVGLQHVPPSPPYSASPRTVGYFPAEDSDAYYRENILRDGRAIKRRRSSPEPSYSQTPDFTQTYGSGPRVEDFPIESVSTRRSYSPEAQLARYEHQHDRTKVPRSPVSSTRTHVSKLGFQHAGPSSSHSPTQLFVSEDDRATPSSNFAQPLTPVEKMTLNYVHRSPPRSKPRPKKPGSAALAMMEKEFRDVALVDKERRISGEHEELSTRKTSSKTVPPWPHTHMKEAGIRSRARQSNERGAADDEEVDDFFQSTFDSPRPTERQISSRGRSSIVTPSDVDKESSASPGWGRMHQGHSVPSHMVNSYPNARSSSMERMDVMSDQYSPSRTGAQSTDERMMSEVEADILGELGDVPDAVTSEDERTELDEQEIDNMEVDVDKELLSLIDEPAEHDVKPRQVDSSLHPLHKAFAPAHSMDLSHMPMPPPDAFKSSVKASKKGPPKPQSKDRTDDLGKGIKAPSLKVGTMEEKVCKVWFYDLTFLRHGLLDIKVEVKLEVSSQERVTCRESEDGESLQGSTDSHFYSTPDPINSLLKSEHADG